mgnify:CR=1 FL=1
MHVNWWAYVLRKIFFFENFIFDKLLKWNSIRPFYSQHLFNQLANFCIWNSLLNCFLDLCLRLVDDNFLWSIKAKPYFSKIPYKLIVLIRMERKLRVIIWIPSLRLIFSPVTNNMLKPPIIISVTSYEAGFDLSWLKIVSFEIKNNFYEAYHSFYGFITIQIIWLEIF